MTGQNEYKNFCYWFFSISLYSGKLMSGIGIFLFGGKQLRLHYVYQMCLLFPFINTFYWLQFFRPPIRLTIALEISYLNIWITYHLRYTSYHSFTTVAWTYTLELHDKSTYDGLSGVYECKRWTHETQSRRTIWHIPRIWCCWTEKNFRIKRGNNNYTHHFYLSSFRCWSALFLSFYSHCLASAIAPKFFLCFQNE